MRRFFPFVALAIGLVFLAGRVDAYWQSRDSGYDIAQASSSVTVDAAGTPLSQVNGQNFNYTGLTISAGLTNPALVCTWQRAHASNDVTTGVAATWDGVSLTLIKSQTAAAVTTKAVFLFALRAPASGNKTLALSSTNLALDNFVSCISLFNVNQASDATAFPNPTGATSGNNIAVTSASGHIAIGSAINQGGNGTVIPTAFLNDGVHGNIINGLADYVVSTSGATTVGTSQAQVAIAGMDVSN